MPLEHGKSHKAWLHNLKAEIHAGKPQKQALAIAYSVQRKAQHKAEGGDVKCYAHGTTSCPKCAGPGDRALGKYMAKGGQLKGVHEADLDILPGESRAGMQARFGSSIKEAGYGDKALSRSKEEHKRVLKEMRGMKKPELYSEGGRVANDTDRDADFAPDEFDDLVLADNLEQHYTGKNSGDELGYDKLDRDDDLISRVHRKYKQRNPRPA